jgi:uncharacterized protein (TIRG00374 family)
MSKKNTFTSLLVGAAFSTIGFYLAFRNVPIASLWHYAGQVNYWWMAPAAAALMIAFLIRSLRWQWLLMPAGHVRFSSAYHSLMISMMLNCLLPGRIGELARPLVIKKQDNIPFTTSLAALGVERLLDLLTLLILLIPTLMTLRPDAETTVKFGDHQLSRAFLVDLGNISLGTVIFLILVVYAIGHDSFRSRLLAFLRGLPIFFQQINLAKPGGVLHRAVPHLSTSIERAAQGVKYICNIKGFLLATFTSLVFWSFNALSFYFLSISSPGIALSFIDICGVMVVICFFIALPSVPGYWGLWEAAGVFALSFFDVPNDVAAGYSLFSHAFNIIPVIAAGWLSCIALGFRWTGLAKDTTSDHIRG